ncbi:MAG: penicillin-insensitive murein endopeptidase [Hyphomicrobiales bacterium]|nr:penicillin-insensitive murein endopeptidase [Hyphomicrobiales bacterium]MDE2017431.1 penicillin-insensitive murein endopeptidase [Hyphomicrobiales bacterium]
MKASRLVAGAFTAAALASAASRPAAAAQASTAAPSLTKPAKFLFAAVPKPDAGSVSAPIGRYWNGCMSGAVHMPGAGPSWQTVRPDANREWGTPFLLSYLRRISAKAQAAGVWRGIIIGDMSQPRGGPLPSSHVSHQVGLEADVWFRPMPDHVMTHAERDTIYSTVMTLPSGLDVDPKTFTQDVVDFIRISADDPAVDRMFVNPAIKKALCRVAKGAPWMTKVRPYWGHRSHYHVRLVCPPGAKSCVPQEAMPPGDGCDKSLNWWFTPAVLHPKPNPKAKPRPPLTLAGMPAACRAELTKP